MDRIARALGIHPLELRRRNMLRAGDTTATGQRLALERGLAARCSSASLARSGFAGMRGVPERRAATVDAPARRARHRPVVLLPRRGLHRLGRGAVEGQGATSSCCPTAACAVLAGSTEIGQGTHAMFLAIAAEALGATRRRRDRRRRHGARARLRPDRRVAHVHGRRRLRRRAPAASCARASAAPSAMRRACASASARSRSCRRAATAARVAHLRVAARPRVGRRDVPRRRLPRVRLGRATWPRSRSTSTRSRCGSKRFWTAVDVGKRDPAALVEGQIEGGILQAIGFAHLEVIATRDGRFVQDRMATCIIPTTLDTPPFEVSSSRCRIPTARSARRASASCRWTAARRRSLPRSRMRSASTSSACRRRRSDLMHALGTMARESEREADLLRRTRPRRDRIRRERRAANAATSPACPPARRAARRPRAHRHEGRLRRGRVRRVHGARRRRSASRVPRPGVPGRGLFEVLTIEGAPARSRSRRRSSRRAARSAASARPA